MVIRLAKTISHVRTTINNTYPRTLLIVHWSVHFNRYSHTVALYYSCADPELPELLMNSVRTLSLAKM